MGGAVSAGEDNDELIDNLVEAEYIKSSYIEQVFRAVDRGYYYLEGCKDNAYRDLAWKHGNIHLSAPCIYSEVMESLNLGPGMSFLNLGSGTGYLSTMAGLVLGTFGTNHGIELHSEVVDYAQAKLEEFQNSSPALDKYEFCAPNFVVGNCLLLDSCSPQYDRVYCGASCPTEHENYIKNLVRVGGILVMPLNDHLLQVTRTGELTYEVRNVLPVSFASLVVPDSSESHIFVKLPEKNPLLLQEICRSTIRVLLRSNAEAENPSLKDKKKLVPSKRRKTRRRIRKVVIPVFDDRNQARQNARSSNPNSAAPDDQLTENKQEETEMDQESDDSDKKTCLFEVSTSNGSKLPSKTCKASPVIAEAVTSEDDEEEEEEDEDEDEESSNRNVPLSPAPGNSRWSCTIEDIAVIPRKRGIRKESQTDSESSRRESFGKASDSGRESSSFDDARGVKVMGKKELLETLLPVFNARISNSDDDEDQVDRDAKDLNKEDERLSESSKAMEIDRQEPGTSGTSTGNQNSKETDVVKPSCSTRVRNRQWCTDSGIDVINVSDDSVPDESSSDPEKSNAIVPSTKIVNTRDSADDDDDCKFLKRIAVTKQEIYVSGNAQRHTSNCIRKAVVFKRITYSDVDSDDLDEFDSDSGKESFPKEYDAPREKSDLTCYSYYMKQKINQLPLPQFLKMYLNYSKPV